MAWCKTAPPCVKARLTLPRPRSTPTLAAMTDAIRATLTARLDALAAEDAATKDARAVVQLDQQAVGRLSRMDALQNQAMAEAQSRRRQADRQRIEAALKRLDTGDYGFCLECGEEIAPDRLALDPALALCADCMRTRR